MQFSALYVFVVWIIEAIARKFLEAGSLIDGKAKTEDVCLGQLAWVDVHLEEFWGHVSTISLLGADITAIDGSHMSKVSDLVIDLLKVTRAGVT